MVIFLHSANSTLHLLSTPQRDLTLRFIPCLVVIFAGLLAFMVRFVREPRADYGIGTAGLIMVRSEDKYRPRDKSITDLCARSLRQITLGLRLASKWSVFILICCDVSAIY